MVLMRLMRIWKCNFVLSLDLHGSSFCSLYAESFILEKKKVEMNYNDAREKKREKATENEIAWHVLDVG